LLAPHDSLAHQHPLKLQSGTAHGHWRQGITHLLFLASYLYPQLSDCPKVVSVASSGYHADSAGRLAHVRKLCQVLTTLKQYSSELAYG